MHLRMVVLAVVCFTALQLFAQDSLGKDSLTKPDGLWNKSLRINASAGTSYWIPMFDGNSDDILENFGGVAIQFETHFFKRRNFGFGLKGIYFRIKENPDGEVSDLYYVGPSVLGGFVSRNGKIYYHCGVSGGFVSLDDSRQSLMNAALYTELGTEYRLFDTICFRLGLSYLGGSVSYEQEG